MNELNFLSIVTIALKVDNDLLCTYKSVKPMLVKGAKWILIVSQDDPIPKNYEVYKSLIGKDTGLYNALNKGIELVDTEHFMFLHSGDEVLVDKISSSLELCQRFDIVLGGAYIGRRHHRSKLWSPWMFKVFIQPPHIPIIYNRAFVGSTRFNEKIEVVSDYYMLMELFERNPRWLNSGKTYINMKTGGLTTNGLTSIMLVTRSFYLESGLKAYLILPVRIILKMIIS